MASSLGSEILNNVKILDHEIFRPQSEDANTSAKSSMYSGTEVGQGWVDRVYVEDFDGIESNR